MGSWLRRRRRHGPQARTLFQLLERNRPISAGDLLIVAGRLHPQIPAEPVGAVPGQQLPILQQRQVLPRGDALRAVGMEGTQRILEAQKDLTFSTDRYLTAWYDGPYAVRLSGVSVAGTEE